MSNYIPTIGMEVHVELKTNSKIFSGSKNGYGMMANSLTNIIDLGYPGALPTVNKEVLKIGVKAAHVLNCNIRKKQHFDRKNYFYPDLPKGYQITEARSPIEYGGYQEIEVEGKKKKIELEEIHIEEDTCKSAHRGEATLLDFNRAGVPLLEIVTKPCIENSTEAKLYLEKLKEILFYADISDCKMEEGSMRCEANVSLRKVSDNKLGTKCEIKNIGSITNVGLAIDYEIKRQEELLENGEVIKEQTRRFDDKTKTTILMRVKETGNDYRYFPEPDIPYVVLSDDFIKTAISEVGYLPDQLRNIYLDKNITLVNANKLIANKELSDFINKFLDIEIDLNKAANLLLGDISSYLNKKEITITDTKLTTEKFIDLVKKIETGELTSKNLKDILDNILEEDKTIDEIIKDSGISNITDSNELIKIVMDVINENEDIVKDYKAGKDRALKYLMGQIMKETKGSANPKMVNDILVEELNK